MGFVTCFLLANEKIDQKIMEKHSDITEGQHHRLNLKGYWQPCKTLRNEKRKGSFTERIPLVRKYRLLAPQKAIMIYGRMICIDHILLAVKTCRCST